MEMDDERDEELSSLTAIFPEIEMDTNDKYSFSLQIPVTPREKVNVRFVSSADAGDDVISLSHLPDLRMRITLPPDYPADAAPTVRLSTKPAWIPQSILEQYENEATETWERDGRTQMCFHYVDSLQQAAEIVFGLSKDGILVLDSALRTEIAKFNDDADKRAFDAETFECGVCFDPKKGRDCHKLHKCGHVFCRDCFQAAYNAAIISGDIASVKCLFPDCGVERDEKSNRATKAAPTLGPDELLEIPIVPAYVVRYVNLNRKKRFDSFPQTVICPRSWCQGYGRSKRYPKRTPESMTADDLKPEAILAEEDAEPKELRNNEDRLRICEDCDLAFCRVCLATWHGEYVKRCWPRTKDELTQDELASRAYLLKNTSPCPSCDFAIQKSMGCNHITCFNCKAHFCYLCSSWLDPGNPYEHFNKPGSSCHQRLWDMEEGDNVDGQNEFLGIRGAEMAAAMAAELDAQEQAQQGDGPGELNHVQQAQEVVANLNLNADAADPAAIEAQQPAPDNQAAPAAELGDLPEDVDGFDWDEWNPGPANWRAPGVEPRPAGRPRRQNRHPQLGGNAQHHQGADWPHFGGGGHHQYLRNRRALARRAEQEIADRHDQDDANDNAQRELRRARRQNRQAAAQVAAAPLAVAAQQPQNQVDAQAIAIAGLQRFLAMAAEDREDEWDSDEMEDDEMWAIPDAPPRERVADRPVLPFLMVRR